MLETVLNNYGCIFAGFLIEIKHWISMKNNAINRRQYRYKLISGINDLVGRKHTDCC